MTDEYLAKMLAVACDMVEADGATLFVVDGEVLRPYLVYRLPVDYIRGIGTVRIGTQCCGRAVEHKRPWIVEDMLSDPLFEEGRAGALASPIRAAFSVPVMDGEKVIASLACHFNHAYSPSQVDIERNEAFAKLFAISLRARHPSTFAQPYLLDSNNKLSQLDTILPEDEDRVA
ncbi:MAG TPA: GAF domain-containing protein [Acidobacteriaceae bacterium]|nr:GAF domain-containing protein [Acidobacteriaceae bacterium]